MSLYKAWGLSAKVARGFSGFFSSNEMCAANIAGRDGVMSQFSAVEICAGGGGQALGLEKAGFDLEAATDIDPFACETLRGNRPEWKVLEADIREIEGRKFKGIDLLAGGVPCPPFSIAGKQLGSKDDRDLFPEAVRLIHEIRPMAVMLENVRGFATNRFASYRRKLLEKITGLGYQVSWSLLNASDFGVSQLRPRFVLIALTKRLFRNFVWPERLGPPLSVGDSIVDLMASRGWPGAAAWRLRADGIAPTLVGGSKKHGGPDLGPTRAKRQWAALGIDGMGLADLPPGPDFPVDKMPKLTVRMTARIQGFPDSWVFSGGKTAAYRQVGNAFPPPVAFSVGMMLIAALNGTKALRRPAQFSLLDWDLNGQNTERNRQGV